MANFQLREKAIQLRFKGATYGQIKKALGVTKSTLSDWLRNLPLTEKQLELLSYSRLKSREVARERYRNTRKGQKLARLKYIYQKQRKELLPLSEKELFLAGTFLYWGEGTKMHGRISISNTDPRVMKFVLYWMVYSLKIPAGKIKVHLHLYNDMDFKQSINFWSEILGLPKSQFRKPYIKKTNREGLTHKGFGYGTCKLYVYSVTLSERVAMAIKSISDSYGVKDKTFWYN